MCEFEQKSFGSKLKLKRALKICLKNKKEFPLPLSHFGLTQLLSTHASRSLLLGQGLAGCPLPSPFSLHHMGPTCQIHPVTPRKPQIHWDATRLHKQPLHTTNKQFDNVSFAFIASRRIKYKNN